MKKLRGFLKQTYNFNKQGLENNSLEQIKVSSDLICNDSAEVDHHLD